MIQRRFIPGSEWVYIKLYTGNKTADEILIRGIYFIIRILEKRGLIRRWFFIRYTDPDFHLRIRLLTTNNDCIGDVIHAFYDKLNYWVKSDLIWKVQLDTYNRELERYGGPLIEEAELFFYVDSECALSIMKKIETLKNENYRWMIALKMIDELFVDFSLDIMARKQIMDQLSNSFKTEFGFNEYNSKQFNSKYRENKNTIESILKNTINDKNFISLCLPVKHRSKRMVPVVGQLQIKLKKQNNKIALNALLISYIHMMINRLFRSKNRMHELILYDFMSRYYTSEIARRKYNPEM